MTERSSRVAAARKLTRRSGRERAGEFLAEGRQSVVEALIEHTAGNARVRQVLATSDAISRHPDIERHAATAGVAVWLVTERAAASLSETVTPQGVAAVCALPDPTLDDVLSGHPRLVAVLVDVSDPGNAGSVVRVADAAGCGAVVFAGDTVDPYNGKAVRASTGSVFHLPLVRTRDARAVLTRCREAGLRVLGADGSAESDLHTLEHRDGLTGATAWVFGSEAHGLGEHRDDVDEVVRVPIYGRAESLNLATAAAVCVYASARAEREPVAEDRKPFAG